MSEHSAESDAGVEPTVYHAELREFLAKQDAGTLTMEEELRGLCRFDWVNVAGFGDPEFTGLYVAAEDVIEILDRWATSVTPPGTG